MVCREALQPASSSCMKHPLLKIFSQMLNTPRGDFLTLLKVFLGTQDQKKPAFRRVICFNIYVTHFEGTSLRPFRHL